MPTVSNARAEAPRYWPTVPERVWDSIREREARLSCSEKGIGKPSSALLLAGPLTVGCLLRKDPFAHSFHSLHRARVSPQ